MSIYKRILCPTDLSESSFEGLETAAGLLDGDSGELVVLYVEREQKPLIRAGLMTSDEAVATRAAAIRNLCRVVDDHLPSSVRTQPLLRQGDAGDEIARAALELDADLIVLTAHGAGANGSNLPGVVANQVIRQSPCPVLLVRRPTIDISGHRDSASHLRPEFEMVHAGQHALYLDGD